MNLAKQQLEIIHETHIEQELLEINDAIRAHEDEIKYLEEVLVSTSGNADKIVDDLNSAREGLSDLNHRFAELMEELNDLRNL